MLPSAGLPALPPSAHPAIGFSSHLETSSALFAGSKFEKILTKKVSVGGLIWGRERSGDCMEETVTAAKLFQSPEIGQTSYLQFGSLFFRNQKQNHEQVEKAILTLTQNQKCKTLKTDKYVKN